MKYIDVFNGDADGIFALIQWRKAYPINVSDEHYLITGVKRDIKLLSKIDDDLAKDAVITVLDISFDKNSSDVQRILKHCQSLFYCDHHKADTLFNHDRLITKINTEPTVCTGLLINGTLKNQYPLWAVTALFGDGLDNVANNFIDGLNKTLEIPITDKQREQLKELGMLVNYNGYGSTIDDLHFEPAQLYHALMIYDTPFDVVSDKKSPFSMLRAGYESDITKANASELLQYDGLVAVVLQDVKEQNHWTRRISGTYGNQLAANNPDKPVVVATVNAKGSYTISLRSPKNNPYGASTICSQFATGGGREGAAGVNELPLEQLSVFINVVSEYY